MTEGSRWPQWTIAIPLAGAVASLLVGRRAPLVAALAAIATSWAAIEVAFDVVAGGAIRQTIGGWGAPVGIDLRADGASAVMLAAFGAVSALAGGHALLGFHPGPVRSLFCGLWLLGWAALDALLLSADVFNLYVALELLTLTAAGLVTLAAGAAGISAALRYLVVSVLGSLGYLTGVALLYGGCAVLDIGLLARCTMPATVAWTAWALVATGLSLKSAVFPLHAWLPPAYAAAAPSTGALLSGIFGKAAFVVALRAGVEVFPVLLARGSGQVLGLQGGLGVLWASLVALRQRRLKALLGYSSLAHVGYLFLAFAIGSAAGRAAAVYVAISHATASAAMFTAAGTVERSVGSDSLDALKGVAHRNPVTFFTLAIGGVSLVGLPPTGGFVAKWLLVRAALEAGQWWWAATALAGGLVAAGYVFRFLRDAFLPLSDDVPIARAPSASELVSFALAVLTIVLGVFSDWPLSLLGEARP